jgi:hypothetical protein
MQETRTTGDRMAAPAIRLPGRVRRRPDWYDH